MIFILVSLTSNLTICWLFVVNKKMRVRSCYYYILSLAISDILIALFSMPPMVSYQLTRLHFLNLDLRNRVLLFIDIIDIIGSISSVTNLTCISLDRLFGTLTPFKHRLYMTRRTTQVFIYLAWVYSITLALMKLVPYFYNYIVFVFTLGFAVPLLIIVLSYTVIFIVATYKKKQSRTVDKDGVMLRTVLVVVILFSICWSPFFLVSLLYHFCIKCTFFYHRHFEIVVLIIKLLTYFNSCCNPFIYGYLNMDIRSAFKKSQRWSRKISRISNSVSFSMHLSHLRSAERAAKQDQVASEKMDLKKACNIVVEEENQGDSWNPLLENITMRNVMKATESKI